MGTVGRRRTRWVALILVVGTVAACEDPVRTHAPPLSGPAEDELTRSAEVDGAAAPGVQLQTLRVVSAPPIILDGPADSATVLLTSLMTSARSGLSWRLRVEQGTTWADAGSGAIDCGAGAGVLPPGRCALRRLPFVAGHGAAHDGTLVPGAATLAFELYHQRPGGPFLVGSLGTAITLQGGAPTSVTVAPSHHEFASPGEMLQLTATVAPPSAPQGVLWSSSNASVAVVSSIGLVTAVAPGAALVLGSSSANLGVQGSSLISVGTTPVLGTGVNASPGAWDAVPGMQLSFAAQVVDGPQQVTWSSSSPASVAVTSPQGRATAVTPFTNATLTARSVADNSQFANVNVRVFSLDWRAPSSATLVSTGAVMPPANPLSVTLQAQACQAVTVTAPPFRAATYELVVGTGTVTIGQSTSFQVFDTGTMRCWVYPFTWTPGTAFGTGAQVLRTTMIDHFGGAGGRVMNSFVTITTP